MKGLAILLLCAVSLAQSNQQQLARKGHNSHHAKRFCANKANEGAVTLHENCNQFYKCSYGQAVSYFCTSQLVFNPITKQCDRSQNVDCGSRPVVEENEADCESEKQEVEQPDQEANSNPEDASKICAAENSDGVLVAHKNCNLFYKCSEGVPVSLNCWGNLLYNPYKEECDWPENVECDGRHIIDIDNDGNNGGTGTCNCKHGETAGICAAPHSNGMLIAHEKCDKFYKCDHGAPVAFSCNTGLLYNSYTKQCDWPYNVNCGSRPIPETDNGVEENDNDNEETGGTCNCNPGEAPGICTAPGSNGILTAHEECNKFYKCTYGEPVAFTCQAGLLYNPRTESCDWPQNVNCGDRRRETF